MRRLPEGWQWARFDEVAVVESNLVDPSSHLDRPHIAPNHIESRTGRLLPHRSVREDGVMSGKHLFAPGHILYSKIRPYLAKAVRVDFAGLCSADMYPVSTGLDPRYLLHWLLSTEFTALAAGEQGRSVLPKINKDGLAKLPVPVPPIAEQERIVAAIEEHLSRLDAADASLRSALARLSMFEDVIYRQVLLPDAPRVPLAAVVTTTSGGTPKRARADLYGGPIPWIKSGELGDSIVTATEESINDQAIRESSAKLFPEGTVLVAMYGATIGKLGRVGTPRAATNQAVAAMFPSEALDSGYLWNVLRALRNDLVRLGKGGAQPNISQSILRELKIPLPAMDAQLKANAAVERSVTVYREAVGAAQTALRRSAGLRRSILAAAFAGKLVPQDPNDEPAYALLERIRAERAAATPTKPTPKAKAS